MSSRGLKKVSSLGDLTILQLQCHIYKHAWYDVDMLAVVWGGTRVEHWRLKCERCGGEATEYRDSVTCARIGQRQYQQAPGYLTGIAMVRRIIWWSCGLDGSLKVEGRLRVNALGRPDQVGAGRVGLCMSSIVERRGGGSHE